MFSVFDWSRRNVGMVALGKRIESIFRRYFFSEFLYSPITAIMFFFAFFTIPDSFIDRIIASAFAGIIVGLLFMALMNAIIFVKSLRFRATRDEIKKQRTIEFEGPVHRHVDNLRASGWLFLTQDGLFFKPQKLCNQNLEVWIAHETIKNLSICFVARAQSIVVHGIKIVEKDGMQYNFITPSPKKWKSEICRIQSAVR